MNSLKIKASFLLSAILACAALLTGQSFRGLSVLNDKTVWVSGSNGSVWHTHNRGRKWNVVDPVGFKSKDFRDIHAWNSKEAIVMSAGDSAVFLKTSDAGRTWRKVYANNMKGIFFDALDFNGKNGVAISDPVSVVKTSNKGTFVVKTFFFVVSGDSGETWTQPSYFCYPNDNSESMFAASGSILKLNGIQDRNFSFRFVTGGNRPAFRNDDGRINIALPLQRGEGRGAYSFCSEGSHLIAVGGYWKMQDTRDSTSVYSNDSGNTWNISTSMPMGYRSGVCMKSTGLAIATGTNGTDISQDFGRNWNAIPIPGFNVCAMGRKRIWLAGNKGQIQSFPLRKIKRMAN